MKIAIVFLLCVVAFCFIPIMQSSAQIKLPKRVITPNLSSEQQSYRIPVYRIPGKRASQYTAEDWGTLIDSTWGAGQSAAEQLNVFDTFWSMIDQQWGGFPNLALNWDSMRTVYRSQIGSGLSRGRFYALMSRMWLGLSEMHTFICDDKVESIFGKDGMWQYKSGVPLLVIGTSDLDPLGAAVTPTPDSSSMVYRIDPGNPLGLTPGDLILGYEGIPWKRLYGQLLDKGLPVSRMWSWPGSTAESRLHEVLSAVGWNWGLFDTIDVVKYSTGDTVHLPTTLLAQYTPTLWGVDQLPIAGVSMPKTAYVTWGVVQGTNIGYIYAWAWFTADIPQLFHDAIYDLRTNKKVEGIILDFRLNMGGDFSYSYGGLSQLFNFDPSSNLSYATRNDANNHLGFAMSSVAEPTLAYSFTPTAYPFDRPIAVLIGPACVSSGEYTALLMRYHPMVRSFGKPTAGGFVNGDFASDTIPDVWPYQIANGGAYSNVPGEGHLIHKGVQPDEEVWLTRDGVAKGQDDVVNRAIQWISTLTYAHDIAVSRSYTASHLDSVSVSATLTDSLKHSAILSAIVTDTLGVVRDSILLHGNGQPGDSIWRCRIPVPSDVGFFKIGVRTDDSTQGTYRKLPFIAGFTTAGPVTLDSVPMSKVGAAFYRVKLYVHNGSSITVHGATLNLRCSDPWVTSVGSAVSLPDIPPGTSINPSATILIGYNSAANPTYFNLNFDFYLGSEVYWTYSAKRMLTGVTIEDVPPEVYALSQNFPNPFNPTTVIGYQLPVNSFVTLKIYDVLGREVATLINGKQNAGYYNATFNPANLPSGVYFYRMQAGSFVQTKKLVLVK